jgi:hypothetical protein
VYGREKFIDSWDGFRVELRESEREDEERWARLVLGERLAIPSARMSLCIVLDVS